MRTLPVNFDKFALRKNFKSEDNLNNKPDKFISSPQKNERGNSDRVLALVSATVAVASLGVAAYALKNKGSGNKEEVINRAKEATGDVKTIVEEATAELKDKIATLKEKIAHLEGFKDGNKEQLARSEQEISRLKEELAKLNKELESKAEYHDNWLKAQDSKIQEVANKASTTVQQSAQKSADFNRVAGMDLMLNLDNSNASKPVSSAFAKKIQGTAQRFIQGKDINGMKIVLALLTASSSIWIPTAESLPEKKGGLGEIPVQIAKNLTQEAGVEHAYIVRPLNEIAGVSTLRKSDSKDSNKYTYSYDGKLTMDIYKVAKFEVPVYRNGQLEMQEVEVFYGDDVDNKHKRIMFRNATYFKSNGLYDKTPMVSEAERYAFFSRVVYEFAKIKADPSHSPYYKVYDQKMFDSIKGPDAMVLNDWHSAPIAALMRLKAQFEAENKEIDRNVADKFYDMNLLFLAHNADYQGGQWDRNSEIMNTLFDKYANDIFFNAKTLFTEKKDGKDVNIPDLEYAVKIGNNVNFANMAMCYATKIAPVSPTYSKEIAEQSERGKGLMHVAQLRLAAGTMEGRSNGWDRSVNEISEKNLPKFNNDINRDKFKILKYIVLEASKKLSLEQQQKINTIFPKNMDIGIFEKIVDNLRSLEIPEIKNTMDSLGKDFYELRSMVPVTPDMTIEQIVENQKHNKREFVKYIKDMVAFEKANPEAKLFNLGSIELTDLSDINIDNLDDVPIFNMGVRFTDQKGVDIFAGAFNKLMLEWDNLFPGKPRPIWVTGGEDISTGSIYYGMINGTKDTLNKNKGLDFVKRLILMQDFTPNRIFVAGSDYTLRPSHFEPDGDKWESLYKAVPVIATRVGGHVDSIQDGKNGILTDRTIPKIHEDLSTQEYTGNKSYNDRFLDAKIDDYYDALIKGLKSYYENKDAYNAMKNTAIHGEQSWVQRDEQGKIKDCPLVGHMKDLGFDLQHSSFKDKFAA